jgi:hypothetical protein
VAAVQTKKNVEVDPYQYPQSLLRKPVDDVHITEDPNVRLCRTDTPSADLEGCASGGLSMLERLKILPLSWFQRVLEMASYAEYEEVGLMVGKDWCCRRREDE